MVKVIEYGNVFTVMCNICESKLRFASRDVILTPLLGGSKLYHIVCPACCEKIYLNEHEKISLILEGKLT